MRNRRLRPEQLFTPCEPLHFAVAEKADLAESFPLLGQTRALDAIEFGIGIPSGGFNLVAISASGSGKEGIIHSLLEKKAEAKEVPTDWCYVNNFENPQKPIALELPPGRARKLGADMEKLVQDRKAALPAAFQNESYQTRANAIREEVDNRRSRAIEKLKEMAAMEEIGLVRSQHGMAFVPIKSNKPIRPEDFDDLPEKEKQEWMKKVGSFQGKLEEVLKETAVLTEQAQEKIRELTKAVTESTVGRAFKEVKFRYKDLPKVVVYLNEVEKDVLENADQFRVGLDEQLGAGALHSFFLRYEVNVLVDHSSSKGAPVIVEPNPSFENLLGRIEHGTHMGFLVTNFTLIKPGAFHRANGGYLVSKLDKLLMQPFAWEGLKRAQKSREIRTESLGQMLSLVSTVSLEPEPIPLNTKVVLLCERELYYLLHRFDSEFAEFFKVVADFDEEIPRTHESTMALAQVLAGIAAREKLRPLSRPAAARVIEESARMAGDAKKLSIKLDDLKNIVQQADYWASAAKRAVIDSSDVKQAVRSAEERQFRIRERVMDEMERGVILIDTKAKKVGQINGIRW